MENDYKKKKVRKEEKANLLSNSVISKEKTTEIVQHEDQALKAAAQFFKEEILPFFKIEGTVVGMAPTESIYLELKKFFQDINFVMDDGTWKHFEFQSRDGGVEDLKRFRAYESVIYTMADKFLNKEEMKEIMEEICKSIDLTKEKVLDILSDKFSLSKERAEEYIKLYW